MEVKLKNALPLLEQILRQQRTISERLEGIIKTLRFEPEPVEPTLRVLLKPLRDGILEMTQALENQDSPEASDT